MRNRLVRWVVGGLGDILVTAGLVLLLFVAWQLWWTDVEANRAQSGTVQQLTRDFARGAPGASGPARVQPAPMQFGKAFAILRIPRLGADYARPVFQGTDYETLQEGVGHYDGTAAAGQVGNLALAGHRTTYGRPFHDIDRLRQGRPDHRRDQAGYSVYAVDRHEIVPPPPSRSSRRCPRSPGPGRTPPS